MRDPAWKKHQIKKKWQNIVSVFITVTLLFAIVNGLAKGFSLKNQLASSKWDGKSAFVIALNSKNPSLFIYQPDPKKAVVLTVSGNALYETGKMHTPLEKIGDSLNSGDNITYALSHAYGAKIENYLTFKDEYEMDKDFSRNLFVNFASISTPIKLLTLGWGEKIKSTNITRIDAFRLWWQIKSIRVEELSLVDLSAYTHEIIASNNQKVLGADTISLNRVIAKYLENLKVVSENKKIKIQNGSNNIQAAKLAASFAGSIGGKVVEVGGSDFNYPKTQIIAQDKNSYTANYLAKIFNCDINGAQNSESDNQITVVVGSDFASSYFE